MTTIEVVRARYGRLILDGAEHLALDFFARDISSRDADSYDERAITTDPLRYSDADTAAIRRGMRLPWAPEALWEWLRADALVEALAPIPREADLAAMTDDEWRELRPVVERALTTFITPEPGEYRALGVATKVLHYKRRFLFPICDKHTRAMLGVRVPDQAKRPTQVAAGLAACDVVRREARRNGDALSEIHAQLAARGQERSRVRILDALLWRAY